jgi:hypothetical protein
MKKYIVSLHGTKTAHEEHQAVDLIINMIFGRNKTVICNIVSTIKCN